MGVRAAESVSDGYSTIVLAQGADNPVDEHRALVRLCSAKIDGLWTCEFWTRLEIGVETRARRRIVNDPSAR